MSASITTSTKRLRFRTVSLSWRAGWLSKWGLAAEVYERPQTMFVGQFLGESNVVDGCVVRCHGDRASVKPKGGARTVEANVPSGAVGDAVRLLIRPEMISLGPEVSSVANTVRARVRALDYLGSSIRYMVDTSGGLRHRRSASTGHNHL
jgi:ABC-type Fe3+/spermidine/putrescine transport system ATPase subunit